MVTVVELTHGIYRARTDEDRLRPQAFAGELCRDTIIHPIFFSIAQLAGRIEGEQAAIGNTVAFEDLLIGATALNMGFDVLTSNMKHFQSMPGLRVLAEYIYTSQSFDDLRS